MATKGSSPIPATGTSSDSGAQSSGGVQLVPTAPRFAAHCSRCGTNYATPPRQWECPSRGCNNCKVWQPDDATDQCSVCGNAVAKFTRHHCRSCGYITCTACTSYLTVIPEWSLTEKQRVCKRCAVPATAPVMAGYLMKLGQRTAFFKERFTTRYFELRDTTLLYGKTRPQQGTSGGAKEEATANGSDYLTVGSAPKSPITSSANGAAKPRKGSEMLASSIAHLTNGSISAGSFAGSASPQLPNQVDITGAKVMDVAIHPNAFCIVGPKLPRGYVLSAKTAEEKTTWIEAITRQVALAKKNRGQQSDANFNAVAADMDEDDMEYDDETSAPTEKVLYGGAEDDMNISMLDFDLLTVIGLGSFGRVMKVCHKKTGNIYAMKILDKQQIVQNKMVTHINAEKLILTEIHHPFVVKLYYAFQTRKHLILVLEFLCGGELFFHLQRNKRFSESRARFYAAEIGLALEYIHSKNVLYRDLKPENLVLDRDGHVVLTDFGLAKRDVTVRERTHTFCGTPEYMAPELVRKTGHTTAVDWWSLGVFLYEMVYGLPPFYSNSVSEMYELILHKPLVFPSFFSSELKDLLTKLLHRNPSERMVSGEEFRTHPFFAGVNYDKLLRREIKPEFVPDVRNNDLKYFDKQFLQESTKIAQLDMPNDPSDPNSKKFEGFDYSQAKSAAKP